MKYCGVPGLISLLDGVMVSFTPQADVVLISLDGFKLPTRRPRAWFHLWDLLVQGYHSKTLTWGSCLQCRNFLTILQICNPEVGAKSAAKTVRVRNISMASYHSETSWRLSVRLSSSFHSTQPCFASCSVLCLPPKMTPLHCSFLGLVEFECWSHILEEYPTHCATRHSLWT